MVEQEALNPPSLKKTKAKTKPKQNKRKTKNKKLIQQQFTDIFPL